VLYYFDVILRSNRDFMSRLKHLSSSHDCIFRVMILIVCCIPRVLNSSSTRVSPAPLGSSEVGFRGGGGILPVGGSTVAALQWVLSTVIQCFVRCDWMLIVFVLPRHALHHLPLRNRSTNAVLSEAGHEFSLIHRSTKPLLIESKLY